MDDGKIANTRPGSEELTVECAIRTREEGCEDTKAFGDFFRVKRRGEAEVGLFCKAVLGDAGDCV